MIIAPIIILNNPHSLLQQQKYNRQEKALLRYAEENNIEYVAEFSEDESGKSFENRKQWQRLEKLLQSGDTIVFKDISRFTREAENGYKKYMEDQFPDKKLPEQLTELQKYGLEICWMNNMYSHKKYFYSIMHQSENEVVITFDDDIIYPIDCIKRLMTIHKKYPTCLVCERGQTICYEKNGEIVANPGRWQTISSIGVENPTYSMNPSPGGGCLMPKCAFHPDAVNEDKINELAYNKNDDLLEEVCALDVVNSRIMRYLQAQGFPVYKAKDTTTLWLCSAC